MSPRLRVVAVLGAAAIMLAAASMEYTVQPGDTLSRIAQAHGVTVPDLVDANKIANPDVIYVGQTLVIPSPDVYHVVQAGETLSQIAKQHGTTVAELAEVNGFPNPNLIYPGNRLIIGGEPPTFEPEIDTSGVLYRVKKGDTLARIAAAHGTSVSALASANGINNPDLIWIGQELRLPATGWVCPVPGSSFINDWGFPRNGGRFHEGNDLYAAAGAPVLAPVGGVVEHVDGSIGGLQFWLEGHDDVLYIGTHLSALGAEGHVSAGDVVGYVGDSGNARGSATHLHFEIHPEYNKPINPYPTLVEACGSS